MEERYARNRIYLSEDEQSKLKKIRLLLGGAGIGSVVAECALRLGIENITIVDGDVVEISNLNVRLVYSLRQN
jgi:tRNA A37 threonylcarbamoyladenosine dehydratase